MPNKKILISLEQLTDAVYSTNSIEKVLGLIFKLLQKNYAISTRQDCISFSQSNIEIEMLETLVSTIVKHLRGLNAIEVIKIVPILAGEIFEIEIVTQEEISNNVSS